LKSYHFTLIDDVALDVLDYFDGLRKTQEKDPNCKFVITVDTGNYPRSTLPTKTGRLWNTTPT